MNKFTLTNIILMTALTVASSLTRHCQEPSGDTLDVKSDETITISTDIPQIWINKTKDGKFVSTFKGCIIHRGSMIGGSFWVSTAARFEFDNLVEIDGMVDFYGENSLSLVSINYKINIKKPISLQITEPRSQNYLSMKFLGGYAPSQPSLHGSRYGGPGKGRYNSTNAYATGAGHGGYGGRKPINDTCTYIGGSLGGFSGSALPAFAGPTIELIAAVEMLIDSSINVSAKQVSSNMGTVGGSSGGRVRLWTKKLKLTSKGILYARGSPGIGVNAGGGGGGIVQLVAEEATIEGSTIQVQAGSSSGSVQNAADGQLFILGRQDGISPDKIEWKAESAYREENCTDLTVMPTSNVLHTSSSSVLAFQTTASPSSSSAAAEPSSEALSSQTSSVAAASPSSSAPSSSAAGEASSSSSAQSSSSSSAVDAAPPSAPSSSSSSAVEAAPSSSSSSSSAAAAPSSSAPSSASTSAVEAAPSSSSLSAVEAAPSSSSSSSSFSISPSPLVTSPSSQISSSSSSSSSLLTALPQPSTSSFLSSSSTPVSTSTLKSTPPPTLQTSSATISPQTDSNSLTTDERINQLFQEIKSLKDMNSTVTRRKAEDRLREFENLTSSKELSEEGLQTSISVVMYFNKILLKMAAWDENLDFMKKNVTSLLHSIDNLLEKKVDTKTQDTQDHKSSSNLLIIALEGTACVVMETMDRLNESYSFKTNNIEIYGEAQIDTNKAVNIPSHGESHQYLKSQAATSTSSNNPSPSVPMLSFEPKKTLKECSNNSCDGKLLVLFSVIKNTRLNGLKTNASAQVTVSQVNSDVLTVLVTYNRRPVHKLNQKALLRFNHQLPSETRVLPGSAKCAYLQYSSSNDTGTWIGDGLTKISTTTDQTVCSTNHLTSFAVLMQFSHYKPPLVHVKAINVITYVGSAISLAALLMTILAYIALGDALSARRYKIHLNLSIALGLAQTVFLAGIDSSKHPVLCATIAVALHYLYLSAFSWMAIEGLHLYFKIVTVFNTEGIKLKYYMMFGWGFPVSLVLISAASNHEGYGKGQTCWLSMEEGFRWSFIGPIAAMIGFNSIILVLTLKELLSLKQNVGGDEKRVKTSFKATIILLPLLGTTWCFGFFGFNSHMIVFQYLFALFTSLQGLFIFLFHCIGNTEVRHAMKRLRIKHSSKITSMLNGSSRPPKSHASHDSVDKDKPDIKRDSWVSPTPSNKDMNVRDRAHSFVSPLFALVGNG